VPKPSPYWVERSIHSAADLLDTHTVPRTSTMIALISLNRTWPRLRHTVGFNNGPSPGDKALKPQVLSVCLPWRTNRRSHRLQFIRTYNPIVDPTECGRTIVVCLGASACGFGLVSLSVARRGVEPV
jgi:hypothetical protein